VVSNQDRLRVGIAENCTTLIGSFAFAANYTGPFELNGITSFTGFIAPYFYGGYPTFLDRDTQYLTPVPGLTSFVMADLLFICAGEFGNGGIFLTNCSALESVSVPKATYIQKIDIGNFPGTTFDFSMLTNSITITISGDKVSRCVIPTNIQVPFLLMLKNYCLLLPALETVESELQISSGSSSSLVDINLPALTTSLSINIAGDLSR